MLILWFCSKCRTPFKCSRMGVELFCENCLYIENPTYCPKMKKIKIFVELTALFPCSQCEDKSS